MNIKAPYFKIETFGAVDGPGVRLIAFLQGCPLRCIYCHNPESWKKTSSLKITPQAVIDIFKKNQGYYRNGGITLSGGEPLIHQTFCLELAKLCKLNHISLALDTSAVTFNKTNLMFFKSLIKFHPLWIVDIKHINPKKHKLITGTATQNELKLINFLELNKQPYWIRQVLLPKYTDDPEDLKKIGIFIKSLKYLQVFELLPFNRLAFDKYQQLKITNKLINVPEPNKKAIDDAKKIISKIKKSHYTH